MRLKLDLTRGTAVKFYKYLYTTEKYKSKKDKICRKLKWNMGQINVYVIALSTGEDQLEIFHSALLKQKAFRKNNPVFVVGIANGYGEAVELIQTIVQDIYEKTGTADIKEYILAKHYQEQRSEQTCAVENKSRK